MAFPGTYNFNYVKGDTLEFKVYPKTTSGATFAMDSAYTAYFAIAETKNSAEPDVIYCNATINGDHIDCIIEPIDGELFPEGVSQLLYQVFIFKNNTNSTDYEKLYTLLEGTISITERVAKYIPTTES